MTETEKLARTIRFIILGVVGLLVAGVVFVGGRAGVRWGWDAATTTSKERIAECVEQIQDVPVTETSPRTIGFFRASTHCTRNDGDVEHARASALDDARINAPNK
jgi:hypothetical protein